MVPEWKVAMPRSPAKEFEAYARDCARLAKHPHAPPEMREQLLKMARDWMQAVMDDQEEEKGFTRPSPSGPTHNSS